jgi:eukaryotic-like serine/threonine-protein kinase
MTSQAHDPLQLLTTHDLREHLERALGGSYRVLDELTGGGMARVFTAEDLALGRRIVIKVLSPELAATVNLERFKREIQVAAGLQHANIVPVLTAGDAEGLPYFTMPFVSGRSVRDGLAPRTGLPLRDVLTVLRDVARALAYAHDRGVVHRDIKPDNILWAGGAAAVTDFGIAKAISAARTHGFSADHREPLTTAGMSLGTPAYMAPEQVSADPTADHRTDIYSFGITAYELICGSTPFAGRSQQAILTAHLTEKPEPLAARVTGVPRALTDLVMRCLEKDAAKRPQTAAEILDVLGSVRTGEYAAGRPFLSRRGLAVAIAAGIALTVGGLAWWRGTPATPHSARADLVVVAPFRVVSADAGVRYLREGMIDLLASKLTGEGGLRVLEPRLVLDAWRDAGGNETRDPTMSRMLEMAEWLGAGRLLLGDVVATPTGLVLSSTLVGVPRGDSLARVTVEGPSDSLAILVDRLARDLLASTSGETPARLATLAGTSLPALRAYLDGQARLRRGDYVAATEAFDRALRHDSTFALAGLGMNLAASWFGDYERRAERGIQIAWRERDRLSQRDQAMVEAIAGPRYPEQSSTLEVYRARQRYLQMAGDRADAWYLLGDHIFHFGRTLDIVDPMREALRHFTRAAELDSTYVVGYEHGVDLAAALGDTALVKRFMRMRATAAPDTSTHRDWFYGWVLAQGSVDSAKLAALWRDSITEPNRFQNLSRTAMLTGFGAADAFRSARLLSDGDASSQMHLAAHFWALTAGQSELAGEYLRRAFPDSAGQAPLNRLLLAVRAANVGMGSEADARAAAAQLALWDAGPLSADSATRIQQRATTRVLEPWRLLRGDSSQTERSLTRLRTYSRIATQNEQRDLAVEIAVIEALREALRPPGGRPRHLEHADSLLRNMSWTGTHPGRMGEVSILVGRLFAQRRDFHRAASAVRRRVDGETDVSPYALAQLRDEGKYLLEAGDREGAVRAFRNYLALRTAPDTGHTVEVETVRRALATAAPTLAVR